MSSAGSKKAKEANAANDDVDVHAEMDVPWYRQLYAIKDTLIIVLTPIMLLPIFIASTSKATRCAYSVLIIAVFWMTECLPMSVTALLPVVLMTWLGVMDSKEICKNYLKDANFLFLGGLLISVAVERWGLHKRVALRVLMLVGSKPTWITFGFMAVTGFLSMWLPNIPTTAMMIPIAAAVLKELDAHRKHLRQLKRNEMLEGDIEMKQLDANRNEDGGDTKVTIDGSGKQDPAEVDKMLGDEVDMDDGELQRQYEQEDTEFRSFACALKLSVTYASNVGGLGTIIGCGPNIVFKGQAEAIYGPDTGLNFFSFFMFAFPLMLILLPISWLSLMLVFIGPKKAFCYKVKQ
jgi:sodium-dependent dicarboxylate transporter 2/3/5